MGFRPAPASIGQRLLWFLEHYRPDTASLNCPVVCKLHGPLDVDALRQALARLVQRHEALRTTLVRSGRRLVQHVHEQLPPRFRLVPVGGGPDQLDALIAAELATPVDVAELPLRVTLWRLTPDQHVLCLNLHHLVSDAWSCGIVLQELIRFLAAGPDQDPGLPPVAWQYPDFARWQHEQLSSGALRVHQDYWTRQLQGMRLVQLPPAATTPPAGTRPTGIEVAALDREVFAGLKAVARSERTTPFAVLLALYYLLLARRTGQVDLSVASLFANRSVKGVQSTVGFFANMVVLRSRVDPDAAFRELVRRVRGTVIDGFLHEAIPYQMLPLPAQAGGGRVDDVVFQMLLTPPPGTTVSARGVEFELHTPDSLGSRFGLELGLVPQPTGACQAMLFYTTDRFAPAWARGFLAEYLALARAAAATPERELRPVGR
jgi:hypothetical protein